MGSIFIDLLSEDDGGTGKVEALSRVLVFNENENNNSQLFNRRETQ